MLSFLCTNLHFCYGFNLCGGTFHHFHVCQRQGAISYMVVIFGVTFTVRMCSSRKYPFPPHGRLMEISGGRGVSKTQFFNESTRLGWEAQFKKSSMGGVWIFSGTTQCNWERKKKLTNKLESKLLLLIFPEETLASTLKTQY